VREYPEIFNGRYGNLRVRLYVINELVLPCPKEMPVVHYIIAPSLCLIVVEKMIFDGRG
jgi:hypothetical protein